MQSPPADLYKKNLDQSYSELKNEEFICTQTSKLYENKFNLKHKNKSALFIDLNSGSDSLQYLEIRDKISHDLSNGIESFDIIIFKSLNNTSKNNEIIEDTLNTKEIVTLVETKNTKKFQPNSPNPIVDIPTPLKIVINCKPSNDQSTSFKWLANAKVGLRIIDQETEAVIYSNSYSEDISEIDVTQITEITEHRQYLLEVYYLKGKPYKASKAFNVIFQNGYKMISKTCCK